MVKPVVFVTRKIAVEALARLSEIVQLTVWEPDSPPPEEVLVAVFRRVDGVLNLLTGTINQRVFSASGLKNTCFIPNLRLFIVSLPIGE